MMTALLAAAVAAAMSTHSETLTSDQLVAKATTVFATKDGTKDATVLGTYKGAPVSVSVKCGDICPAYTVRIIHFIVPDGKNCAKLDGQTMSVIVPHGIAAGPESFCIPDPLVKKDLWEDHPYHNS
jgi:hypothetical protein